MKPIPVKLRLPVLKQFPVKLKEKVRGKFSIAIPANKERIAFTDDNITYLVEVNKRKNLDIPETLLMSVYHDNVLVLSDI